MLYNGTNQCNIQIFDKISFDLFCPLFDNVRKGNVLFNDALNTILFMVIWHGKGPYQ